MNQEQEPREITTDLYSASAGRLFGAAGERFGVLCGRAASACVWAASANGGVGLLLGMLSDACAGHRWTMEGVHGAHENECDNLTSLVVWKPEAGWRLMKELQDNFGGRRNGITRGAFLGRAGGVPPIDRDGSAG